MCSVVSFIKQIYIFVFNYNLNGLAIKGCGQLKDLEITCDIEFSSSSHIDETVQKADMMLGFIYRNYNDFQNFPTLNLLFNSNVRS